MRYTNSLTTSVQQHIGTVLARKIVTANTSQAFGSTAKEIRQYLSDPTTVSSPDFVIRRYLQNSHPELLEEYGDLPDLVRSGKNVPWDEKVIRSLANKLSKLSTAQGAKIEAKEWRNYLTGKGVQQRTKAFMAAFTLQMGVEETMDLLLAFGMEPYAVRYPLDLICMFCQEMPGTYTWAEAQAMLTEFLAGRTAASDDAAVPTPGMTEQISTDLKQIFERNLQSDNARAALVRYMAEHSGEFLSFKKGAKEYFLPGYSLSRMDLYQRLTEYLAVLYPRYPVRVTQKDGEGEDRDWDNNLWNGKKEPVVSREGAISLPALARAMFSEGLWSDVIWRKDGREDAFEREMREFCNNYEQHFMAIERLRKGGRNVAFFDRRDALVLTYFFISGWARLCTSKVTGDPARAELLRDMAFTDTEFDIAVEEVMDKVERIFAPDYAGADTARVNSLRDCFDMILAQLDYPNLYLPAQFDRFVLLSLLSGDPAELSTAIMSQGDWEFYYGDEEETA